VAYTRSSPGKRLIQVENTTSDHLILPPKSRLLFIACKLTKLKFLLDTGSTGSFLPPVHRDKIWKSENTSLVAANGAPIFTYGSKLLNVELGFKQCFKFNFTVADVTVPIIGLDFLKKFQLTINPASNTLSQNATGNAVTLTTGSTNCHSIHHVFQAEVQQLISEFPEIMQASHSLKPVKHQVEHYINTGSAAPVAIPVRKMSTKQQAIAKEQITELLNAGVVRPSSSPWAAPIHLVKKTTGDWRLCGDYRGLNNVTVPDAYPLPLLQQFSSTLNNKTVFSTIDLKSAYHQIPVAKDDILKTAIRTPFGSYEFLRTPFGLRGAPQSFQRFINNVLDDITVSLPGQSTRKVTLFVYLDDILIASTSKEEHFHDLRAVFKRLAEYGLVINKDKSTFFCDKLNFLGHTITKDGIIPKQEKVEAICGFAKPRNYQQLRQFCGMLNFYRRFISHAAELLAPLHNLLQGTTKKDKHKIIPWTESASQAFELSKTALAKATLLTFPNENAELSVVCDASNIAIGGVLQQWIESEWQPISFYSRKLNLTEQKYSTFGRELLAVYEAVKHFRHFVEGNIFHILTDHKPMVHSIKRTNPRDIAREERHLTFISQFTTDIRHIKGDANIVADALSRSDVTPEQCQAIMINQEKELLEELQKEDSQLHDILQNKIKFTVPLTKVNNIYCHVNDNGVTRPFLPLSLRRTVFAKIHNMAHPGRKATQRQIGKLFVWPGLKSNIKVWTDACVNCQKNKVTRHSKPKINPIPTTGPKFSQVHIDIVGPLPICQGLRYILTAVDRFTRWPMAVPIPDITAETVAKAFISNWIAHYGIPVTITSDRGSQFESYLWEHLNNLLGIKTIKTTAYHPQGNGLVERFHRRLKESLKASMTGVNWVDQLPLTMLGIRTCVKEDIGFSSFEASLWNLT